MLIRFIKRHTLLSVVLIFAIFTLGVAGWYLGSPLFLNKSVDEELTFGNTDANPAPAEAERDNSAPSDASAAPDESVVTPMADEMADGEANAGVMEDPEQEATAEILPAILKKGGFVDADDFHQGSGTATIYESGGQRVLRLENFMVTNGPDLQVYLAASTRPTRRDDLGEYVDLGALKGNQGNQNYEIPADVDLDSYNSVVIYCEPFHVVFSTATLR